MPVMGLPPRRTQAGATGPESVGDPTVPAQIRNEAAGPEYRLPVHPTRIVGAHVPDIPRRSPCTLLTLRPVHSTQMYLLRDPAPPVETRRRRHMIGPAAGYTTWLDRLLRQDTPTHEPRSLTQSCILGCTLQVRAHSLALTTAETRLHHSGSGRLDPSLSRAPKFAPNSVNDSSAFAISRATSST